MECKISIQGNITLDFDGALTAYQMDKVLEPFINGGWEVVATQYKNNVVVAMKLECKRGEYAQIEEQATISAAEAFAAKNNLPETAAIPK